MPKWWVVFALVVACKPAPPPKPVLRLTYEPFDNAAGCAKVMQRRLGALHIAGTARADGERIVVELPLLDAVAQLDAEDALAQSGHLELRAFDDEHAPPILTETSIAGTAVAGEPASVIVTLDRQGATLLGDWTTAHVGKRLAIVIDQRVFAAPIVNEPILSGRFEIPIPAGVISARALAPVLATGPLPAPVLQTSRQPL